MPKVRMEVPGWTPGCYGMKYPATLVAANAIPFRGKGSDLEIAYGTRAKGRFGGGLEQISSGGFVDPGESAKQAAEREIMEELGLVVECEDGGVSFFQSHSVQIRHRWNPITKLAVPLGIVVQGPPVGPPTITVHFLARWISGEPTTTNEILCSQWHLLRDVLDREADYAFDQALVLEHALERFRKLGLF